MKLVCGLCVLFALCVASVARGGELHAKTIVPSDGVSLSDRLSLGGAGDKAWRAALRFPLVALPPGALVVTAELSLWYDVGDWMLGVPNNGFLLQLPDETETQVVPGPAFPGSSFTDASVRPRPTLWYLLE